MRDFFHVLLETLVWGGICGPKKYVGVGLICSAFNGVAKPL